MGMIDFCKGFFVFDKSWIHDNKFFQSLSHAEFRILLYLLSSALKSSKRDQKYKRGDLIASLYQRNKLLVVNASQRTIHPALLSLMLWAVMRSSKLTREINTFPAI